MHQIVDKVDATLPENVKRFHVAVSLNIAPLMCNCCNVVCQIMVNHANTGLFYLGALAQYSFALNHIKFLEIEQLAYQIPPNKVIEQR